MKINRSYTIDFEIVELLKKEENASDLINELLKKYFKTSEKTEDQILKEVDNKIKRNEEEESEKEERSRIGEFTRLMTDEQKEEYLVGVKLGAWKSTLEYARRKLYDQSVQEGV